MQAWQQDVSPNERYGVAFTVRSWRFQHFRFDSGRLLRILAVVVKTWRPRAYIARECLPTFLQYLGYSIFFQPVCGLRLKVVGHTRGLPNIKMRLYRGMLPGWVIVTFTLTLIRPERTRPNQ